MYVITEIVDELRLFNVPEEVINRVMKRLLHAGAQSVYASLGEMVGKPAITPDEFSLALAHIMAGENDVREQRTATG